MLGHFYIYVAKTKVLISCRVTGQLLCIFVLQKSGFLMTHLIYIIIIIMYFELNLTIASNILFLLFINMPCLQLKCIRVLF